jgi:serine/threonine protein phosphatase 1
LPAPLASASPRRVAVLRGARRIWAVGAIHGNLAAIAAIHSALEPRIWRGDRLVYLGNFLGGEPDGDASAVAATVRELLLFRRAVLARPGFEPDDIVLLRGAQEQMLTRTLELQFAEGPAAAEQALAWMGAHGLSATLQCYGTTLQEGLRTVRQGPVAIGRWTASIRNRIRDAPGHDPLLAGLARAAITVPRDLAGEAPGMLLVAAGLDPARPFLEQGDAFWWRSDGFDAIADEPVAAAPGEADHAGSAGAGWAGFASIVRGADPRRRGVRQSRHTVTLDGRDGPSGGVAAGLFSPEGALLELLRA